MPAEAGIREKQSLMDIRFRGNDTEWMFLDAPGWLENFGIFRCIGKYEIWSRLATLPQVQSLSKMQAYEWRPPRRLSFYGHRNRRWVNKETFPIGNPPYFIPFICCRRKMSYARLGNGGTIGQNFRKNDPRCALLTAPESDRLQLMRLDDRLSCRCT